VSAAELRCLAILALADIVWSPSRVRSNFCWGIGQVIGVGVIKSQLNNKTEWAYRLPWALQWMWLPFLITGVALAPESPWLLVRKGRMEDARKNLLRLTSLNRETGFDADETLAVSP
jgi:SP family general alpha glucoside:H+ symporter-like MFS transporter